MYRWPECRLPAFLRTTYLDTQVSGLCSDHTHHTMTRPSGFKAMHGIDRVLSRSMTRQDRVRSFGCRLTLQCSHRFLTELCTFMPLICCCTIAMAAAGLVIAGLHACVGARALWEMDRTVDCCRHNVGTRRVAGLVRRDSALSDEMSEADIFSQARDVRCPFLLIVARGLLRCSVESGKRDTAKPGLTKVGHHERHN